MDSNHRPPGPEPEVSSHLSSSDGPRIAIAGCLHRSVHALVLRLLTVREHAPSGVEAETLQPHSRAGRRSGSIALRALPQAVQNETLSLGDCGDLRNARVAKGQKGAGQWVTVQCSRFSLLRRILFR